MLRIEFTPEEIQRLNFERYPHPHPRVQRKMEAVYLKALSVPHHEISRVAGICENTLLSYLRAYQAGRLNLVTNAVILWNTVYKNATISLYASQGSPCRVCGIGSLHKTSPLCG